MPRVGTDSRHFTENEQKAGAGGEGGLRWGFFLVVSSFMHASEQ